MAKGIKMTKAHVVQAGVTKNVEGLTEHDRPVQCECCKVPIVYVDGYWLRKDDPDLKRWVKPFLRLAPNHDHADYCKYSTAGQVSIIVDKAEAVEDSINPFDRHDNGLFEFRLNIPRQEIRQAMEDVDADNQGDEFIERKERIWSGRTLASYCRSASGLARLWKMLESTEGREELQQRVRLLDDGNEIRWSDFFFDDRHLDSLSNRVKSKRIKHPAAALVCIRNTGKTKSGQGSVQCVPIEAKRATKATRDAVTIYGPLKLTDQFVEGNHYIIFGEWKFRGENSWSPKGSGKLNILYRNLAVNIFHRYQFCEVEAVGEGDDNVE